MDGDGAITRLLDIRVGRSAAEARRPTELELFQDGPEVQIGVEHPRGVRATAVRVWDGHHSAGGGAGPVRLVVRVVHRYRESLPSSRTRSSGRFERIDFVTPAAQWRERQVLLKAAFPVRVRSDRKRRSGVQFGAIYRRHPCQHLLGAGEVRGLRPAVDGHLGTLAMG